jgi:hypothetical protein
MPSPYLKKLASETGKSESELEKYWQEAKEVASEKFDVKESDFTDKQYAYATSIVKKKAGIKEVVKVSDFINSKLSVDKFIEEVVISSSFSDVLDKEPIICKDANNDKEVDVVKDKEEPKSKEYSGLDIKEIINHETN